MKNQQLLYDLFAAYYDARRNKRNTKSALAFERNYESELFRLHEEIKERRYEIRPSTCFINWRPVQREIFAADFRDRIIHHLVFNAINPIFERVFINDSYSCRKGKGTSYGISRLDHFIRSCSQNYQQDCYVLKLDIKGYFMAINRQILFGKLMDVLDRYRFRVCKTENGQAYLWGDVIDYDTVVYLLQKIVFYEPTQNYIRRGKFSDWQGLPPSKSLFHASSGCGLPIGNLTSQLFSNVYMNAFDHWMQHTKHCRNYGRYVDDFFVVHKDKELLKKLILEVGTYLGSKLELELHPNKIYLQHYSKGVSFLGAVIKPYRKYVAHRTKGNFHERLLQAKAEPSKEEVAAYVSSVNSYLGICRQFSSFRLRKKMVLNTMPKQMWKYVFWENYSKLRVGLKIISRKD